MSDLIKVPEWFDEIYRYVQHDCGRANLARMKFIQAIVKQGWGTTFIVEIVKDDELFLTESTTEHIKEINKQEDISQYILVHGDDLIKALIDGYEVKEEKYIVVAKTIYDEYEKTTVVSQDYGDRPVFFASKPFRKIYYENNMYQEDYIGIREDVFSSGLIMGECSPEILSLLHGKPELIMNKEEAEKLMNSYRMMISVNI